jgi:5-methyltetrahydropteroyltriglutamate--homocysteine methyltransferase
MAHYGRYTTPVMGAHSVPGRYDLVDRLVALGQRAAGDFADAQLRATQAAILNDRGTSHRARKIGVYGG